MSEVTTTTTATDAATTATTTDTPAVTTTATETGGAILLQLRLKPHLLQTPVLKILKPSPKFY